MSSGLAISFRSTGVLFMHSCFSGPISVHQVALALCSQLTQDCGVRLCKLLSNNYIVRYHSIPRPLSCISATCCLPWCKLPRT